MNTNFFVAYVDDFISKYENGLKEHLNEWKKDS